VVSATDGLAIIAVRTTSVDNLGHVGVGFQNEDGTWTIGGIENTGGSPVVIPGADNRVGIASAVGSLYNNGGWTETKKTLTDVEVIFHSLSYDGFKIIQVSDSKSNLADAEINKFPTRGYDVVTNNCLSATIDVLTAYGVKDLPYQIAHVAPNDYYANVKSEEYLWDAGKKKYTDINTGMPLVSGSGALTAFAGSSTDSNPPIVQAFQVTPLSLTTGESFTIHYTVYGSGLKQVELWRTQEMDKWPESPENPIQTKALMGKAVSGSFTDSPSAPGKYWYGLHVVDNTGNWNDEKNTNTNKPSVSNKPVEVEVKSESTQTTQGSENNGTGYWTFEGTMLINFKNDGTFRTSEGGSGSWEQIGDTIRWRFGSNSDGPIYEGKINMNQMEGVEISGDSIQRKWSAKRGRPWWFSAANL
jgi:hypothetical protein